MTPEGRYDRHVLMPELGPEGQARLDRARVLCVGAGGLGCAALPYLAGAGVGTITILDPDRVSRSNLQRQVLYQDADVGAPKAVTAAKRLRALNPDIEIVAREERFDASNASALLEEHDIVLDGSDNYATKFLLGDATALRGVPLVYGSVTGLDAMVTIFDARRGPCLRCIYPQPPQGWVPNCSEAGVLGPLVGMVGAIQAAETVKHLASEGRSNGLATLAGRLWVLDARDMSSRQVAIQRREGCPTCAGHPEPVHVPDVACASPVGMDAATAQGRCDTIFIDVREAEEYARGHIPGALNLPLSSFHEGLARELPPADHYLLYCSKGPRSIAAAEILARTGLTNLSHLQGGLGAWTGRLHGSDDPGRAGSGDTTARTESRRAS